MPVDFAGRPQCGWTDGVRLLISRDMRSPALFIAALACALPLRAEVPSNLVTEGIPAIPPTLQTQLEPYLQLDGVGFRGWHPTRREMLVATRLETAVQLHRLTEPQGTRTPLTTGTEPVSYGWYRPGGADLVVFERDRGGSENYQFYALDPTRAGSTPVLLTDGQARNTSPQWSYDGHWLAYASTRRNGKDSDIFLVDPTDPKTTRCLLTNDSPAWTPADWTRDSATLLVRRHVTELHTELWLVDAKTGERKLVTPADEKHYFGGPILAEKGQAIYALTDADSDFLTLTRIDCRTGKRSPLTQPLSWDVEDFALSGDEKTLAFVVNEDGFGRLHLLDLATRTELPVPKIPGDLISSLTWHQQRRELGFTLNGAQSPSDVWSLEADTGRLTRWAHRDSKLGASTTFAEPKIVRVTSHDGVSISSLVYRPDPAKFPGKRQVLVSIHGGPSAQSRPGFRGATNYFLNELGVAVVYPNVRGSTGYGRKFMTLDNDVKREDAVRDIGAVLDGIVADPGFDPARIAVMGGSYGGFMTLASLVQYPDRFRCGVDVVGIANFATFLRDTSAYRRDNRREEYGDERKPEVLAFLDRISPANNAAKIRAPLFIVQGKNDPRVPVTEAERMRDAIRQAGGNVWYLMAQDEGHGFAKKPNADFQFQATVLFLREHLLK